jgi:hypothetical protein
MGFQIKFHWHTWANNSTRDLRDFCIVDCRQEGEGPRSVAERRGRHLWGTVSSSLTVVAQSSAPQSVAEPRPVDDGGDLRVVVFNVANDVAAGYGSRRRRPSSVAEIASAFDGLRPASSAGSSGRRRYGCGSCGRRSTGLHRVLLLSWSTAQRLVGHRRRISSEGQPGIVGCDRGRPSRGGDVRPMRRHRWPSAPAGETAAEAGGT